jgi:hypothetical protein
VLGQDVMKPSANLENAALNYGLALALAATIGGLSHFSGDAPGLVALKSILAPFYLLANRAVPTFFREPLVEPRWTGRAVEAHLLMAALFAGFMTLALWKPELTVSAILLQFAFMMAVMGVTQMVILGLHIRRLRNGAS